MANGIPTSRLLALALIASPIFAQETDKPAEAPARRIGIIFGGAFEALDITGPIEGAKSTKMAAQYEWSFGVRPFTKKTWEERGLQWETFFPIAREVADAVATKLEPRLVRDHRGIVLYAIIADEDPFLTSAILSPKLHERFKESLGDRIHVLLLERNRIYLFPATGGTLEEFGPSLVEQYRQAQFPVSLEIFLLDRDGFRVVGELERPSAGPEELEVSE
ncbi:MAG: hypothetical protein JNJ70_01440 [Verrucomicrobiales bacterium]|nr:hypothetical protein [Verrucomicrobiales bacterium]